MRKHIKNVIGTVSCENDMLVKIFTEDDRDLCTDVIMNLACDDRVLDWADEIEEGEWASLVASCSTWHQT